MSRFYISSSILSANFFKLGKEIKDVIRAGVDWIHIDVMDNHYVPNLTFGPLICKSIRSHIRNPIDVHLMTCPVDRIITDFISAGANIISFHPETSNNIDRTISLIKDSGCHVGLVFNPTTSLKYLNNTINKIDVILIMSVYPGFGGQKFLISTFDRLKEVIYYIRYYKKKNNCNVYLSVDGGINKKNVSIMSKMGVDIFVIGSSIFNQKKYDIAVKNIRCSMFT